jgi:hypothetical protein
MAVFIKRPPVTSSNCYETMKNDSVLMKLGTHLDWTIVPVTACSFFNFLLPWQRGMSQNSQKSLFCIFCPENCYIFNDHFKIVFSVTTVVLSGFLKKKKLRPCLQL